jgi:hypothetical protein
LCLFEFEFVVELRFRYLRSPALRQGLLPHPLQLSVTGFGFALGFGELPSGARSSRAVAVSLKLRKSNEKYTRLGKITIYLQGHLK